MTKGSFTLAVAGLVLAVAFAGADETAKKKPADDKAGAAKPKPARTFTDEDLKKYKGERSESGEMAAPSPTADERPRSESREGPSAQEADWRGRAADARAPVSAAQGRVAEIEGEMSDLRDQLNPMSTRYLLGGNSNAGPGAVLEAQERLRSLEGELQTARSNQAEAEKGLARFLDEARAAGVNPDWLKP